MFKRGSGKYNSSVLSRDYYEWYICTVSDPLPYGLFKAIFKDFIEEVMVEVIFHNYEFSMPAKMGSIYIREKTYEIRLTADGEIDKSRLVPDWQKTLKKWAKLYPDTPPEGIKNIENKPMIYLENEHTDGTLKQWYWNKVTCNFKYQNFYKFNATRTWDRVLAKANKEKNITYHSD